MIGLMCNLTEHSATNRRTLLTMKVPYTDYTESPTTSKPTPTLTALTKVP